MQIVKCVVRQIMSPWFGGINRPLDWRTAISVLAYRYSHTLALSDGRGGREDVYLDLVEQVVFFFFFIGLLLWFFLIVPLRAFGTSHYQTLDTQIVHCLNKWLRVDGKYVDLTLSPSDTRWSIRYCSLQLCRFQISVTSPLSSETHCFPVVFTHTLKICPLSSADNLFSVEHLNSVALNFRCWLSVAFFRHGFLVVPTHW